MSPKQRAPARTPDTTMFTVLHRAMRRDAARLAAVVAAPGDRRHAAALSRWYRGYRSELTNHHHVEDEVFFPVLAARVPSFAAHSSRIDAEHHMLEDALDGVQAALAGLAGDQARTHARGPARDRAVAATRELSDLLDRHLSFEDADVVPLYVRHFGADEYAEVERRALKLASKANLPFTVPWVMTATTDAERARLLGQVPLAFRLLWWASRRRYARLADRALRPCTPYEPTSSPNPHDFQEVA